MREEIAIKNPNLIKFDMATHQIDDDFNMKRKQLYGLKDKLRMLNRRRVLFSSSLICYLWKLERRNLVLEI